MRKFSENKVAVQGSIEVQQKDESLFMVVLVFYGFLCDPYMGDINNTDMEMLAVINLLKL